MILTGRKVTAQLFTRIARNASNKLQLKVLLTQRFLTFRCVPCVKIKNTDIVLPIQEGPQLP